MKKIILSVFGLLISILSVGQTSINVNENFVPKAPNAAMLDKFTDVPVSLAFGIPEISIPLYTVQSGSISVPIVLRYHAGGIKNLEAPSWVGLGWDLECGGKISRTINSNPDEGKTYITSRAPMVGSGDNWSQSNTGNVSLNYVDYNYRYRLYHSIYGSGGVFMDGPVTGPSGAQQLLATANQNNNTPNPRPSIFTNESALYNDGESDDYYITTPGLSTKAKINTISQFVTFPIDPSVKIKVNYQSMVINATTNNYNVTDTFKYRGFNKWAVSKDNGMQYYFGTKDSSIVRNGYYTSLLNPISEWGLDKILDINTKDSVLFFNQIITQASINFSINRLLYGTSGPTSGLYSQTGCIQGIVNANKGSGYIPSSPTIIPQQIVTPNNRVQFYTSSQAAYWELDSILVFNKENVIEKKVLFTYFSFKSTGRLKLESVKVVSRDNTLATPAYVFSYYDTLFPPTPYITKTDDRPGSPSHDTTVNSPNYATWAMDYWGYFNGRLVNTVCPGSANNPLLKPAWPHMQLDALTSITYPSGATTKFIFEPNIIDNGFLPEDYDSRLHPLDSITGGLRIKNIITTDPITNTTTQKDYQYYPGILNAVPMRWVYFPYLPPINYFCSNKDLLMYFPVNKSEMVFNAPIVQYNFVTETQKVNGLNNGRVESEFYTNLTTDAAFYTNYKVGYEQSTNINNYPSYYAANRYQNLLAGSLKEKRIYNSAGTLLTKETNVYAIKDYPNSNYFFTLKTQLEDRALVCYKSGSGIPPPSGPITPNYYFSFFMEFQKFMYLASNTIQKADAAGNLLTSTQQYAYESAQHNYPTKTVAINSIGDTLLAKSTYAFDCASTVDGSDFAGKLQAKFYNPLLASYNFKHNSLITSEVSQYANVALAGDTAMFLSSVYHLYKNRTGTLPNDAAKVPYIYPVTSLLADPDYKKDISFIYSTKGVLKKQYLENNLVNSYLWDAKGLLPVLKAINADTTDIAYTGFEIDGIAGWSLTIGNVLAGGYSGKKGYSLTAAPLTKAGFTPSKNYIVSYWINSATPATLSGIGLSTSTAVLMTTAGVWNCYKQTFTGTASVSISGTSIIDDIRIYIDNSEVTSYCYNSNNTLAAQFDKDNFASFYSYDALERLVNVKDAWGNILKQNSYNFAPNPVPVHLFYNTIIKDSAIRNNCPVNYTASKVYYTVPANKYVSTFSFSEVMNMATNDATVNKQAYANANGTCTAPPVIPPCTGCTGISKKCISNICETGIKVYTASVRLFTNPVTYNCTYHYEWSDGTWSVNYTETSLVNCSIPPI